MKYRAGYVFQLAEEELFFTTFRPKNKIDTEFISLDTDGRLVIFSGYAWDGASGPIKVFARALKLVSRWLWKKYVKKFIRGSLFHDAMCQLLRQGHVPPDWLPGVNEHMRRIMVKDGMNKARAQGWVDVLDQFDFYADPANKKEILTAP